MTVRRWKFSAAAVCLLLAALVNTALPTAPVLNAQETTPEAPAEFTPEATPDADLACAAAADGITAPGVNTAAYFVGLGDVFFQEGRYASAIFQYSCALLERPDYVPAYINRGYAHAVQRNDLAALEDYAQALTLAPESVAAYNNRGLLYTRQGSFAAALADFDLAIALAPDDPVPLLNRGVVHAAEGRYDLATADLEQAIALAPDLPAPHAALGAVYLAQSIAQYRAYVRLAEQAGLNSTFPPGGDVESMTPALRDALGSGTFAPWPPLQRPAGQRGGG